MISPHRTDAPIYDDLIEERGDVLAEARRVAEQTQREMGRLLDFSSVHNPLVYR
ncbi:hypothetical protein [Wenjunlia tyrosinilytica]|uniref:Uncharacterized protein n=1 Tax=Wenjunlia tyrosinilytica TaxID=1544741 RepID=A0A917ZVQ2_9ACTN|nr:hypothetical protein [Wenjunlia tyrosinilytica]GGO97917.1 hypothetical protein GCM10012280_60830 [Wenjunlia tyrosinilytica]